MITPAQLETEITDWADTKRPHWHNSDRDFFWTMLENGEEVALASGTAVYEDIETNGDDSLAVFSVGGNFYGLSGSYSSWGSDWDNGVHEVEKRTVTIERWETT